MIKKNAKETKKVDFNIEVSRAKELDNGNIAFDMVANGVSIYGCFYKILQRKDGSGEFAKVDFPQRKGNDGKYYNLAYFFIDDETMKKIEDAITAKLNK